MPRPIRIKYTIPPGAQFGAPRGNGTRIHQGCDYHCPIGTPIYGTGDGGRVTYIGYNGDPITGSGNNVVIAYPGNRITTDMHLRERTPLHVGSPVDTNTVVGYVGITGNAVNADPPGSHDHHQMTLSGKLIDPESFYGTTTAGAGTPITEEDDMPIYELAQAGGDPTVWFCVDRITRYGIPDPTSLNDYKAFIRAHGQSDTVLTPVKIASFGTPVYVNGAPANNVPALMPNASAADIAAALAPLIVPSIVSAVGADLTEAQVQAATEAAVRAVFADAATK